MYGDIKAHRSPPNRRVLNYFSIPGIYIAWANRCPCLQEQRYFYWRAVSAQSKWSVRRQARSCTTSTHVRNDRYSWSVNPNSWLRARDGGDREAPPNFPEKRMPWAIPLTSLSFTSREQGKSKRFPCCKNRN